MRPLARWSVTAVALATVAQGACSSSSQLPAGSAGDDGGSQSEASASGSGGSSGSDANAGSSSGSGSGGSSGAGSSAGSSSGGSSGSSGSSGGLSDSGEAGSVDDAASAAPICGTDPPPAPLMQTLDEDASQGSVTWYGGCWYYGTIYGITGNFQSVDFAMTTSTPLPLEGTLFYASNCDPSQGTDNLNDFGTPTGSTHMVQGFSHHPDVIPSSALFWMGDRTADGTCAPGAPCSGCINYTLQTPCCSALP